MRPDLPCAARVRPVLCNLESGYTIARGAGANGGAKIAHTCRHAGAENGGFVERIARTNVAAVGSSRDRGRTRPDRGSWYLPLLYPCPHHSRRHV
jgi:hypothetical protein